RPADKYGYSRNNTGHRNGMLFGLWVSAGALTVRPKLSAGPYIPWEWDGSIGNVDYPIPSLSPAIGNLGVTTAACASDAADNQIVYIGDSMRVVAVRSDATAAAWQTAQPLWTSNTGTGDTWFGLLARGPAIGDF